MEITPALLIYLGFTAVADRSHTYDYKNIPMNVYVEMVTRNTVVILQYYPENPTSFTLVFHYDLGKAVDIALANLDEY